MAGLNITFWKTTDQAAKTLQVTTQEPTKVLQFHMY